MATINYCILKQQKSKNGYYPICIRLTHLSKSRYISTDIVVTDKHITSDYKIKPKEKTLLVEVLNIVATYDDLLKKINVRGREIDDIVRILKNSYETSNSTNDGMIDFIKFIDSHIDKLKAIKKTSSITNYNTLKNSLIDFTGRPFLLTSDISLSFLKNYQIYLLSEREMQRKNQFGNDYIIKRSGLNKTSLYNRFKDFKILFNACREEYNDEDLNIYRIPNNPFKKFKLGQPGKAETDRSIPLNELVRLYQIYDQYESLTSREKLSLDCFFLSFFLCGINAVDLYTLDNSAIKENRLVYKRSKTKDKSKNEARTSVPIREHTMEIINKYKSHYDKLFVFSTNYSSINNFIHALSAGYKSLSKRYGIPKITYYYARHTFASVARNHCDISIDDIALCLNHSIQTITGVYIHTDYTKIDRAIDKVTELLFTSVERSK